MFKIVQTVERGKNTLTIVPTAWEQKGILFWPKIGASKLLREINSAPETNWISLKCKLKRNYLNTYEMAEEELERMVEDEDTENTEVEEEHFNTRKRPRILLPRRNHNGNIANAKCFDAIAEACEENVADQARTSTHDINQTPIIIGYQVQDEEVHEPETPCNILYQGVLETDVNYVSDDQLLTNKTVIGNVDIGILSTQLDTVIQNQKKLFREVAKLQTTLEVVIKNKNNACSTRLANKVVAPIEPINSLDELKGFDEKLKDAEVFEGYTQSLSFICGRNGKGKGIDHSYMLVDKMFTRNFFTLCSWAGGSKIPKAKFAFKFFEHTISLVFKIVNLADNSFCLEDCEEFFKNVIRNSMRRNQTGNISGKTRTSKSKNRPKKILYEGQIATPENGKGKGIDHSYMLVDKMFTRNFFTLCSWAGGSKIPKAKFAFKFFEHTISLFFKIVNLADNSFCLEDCEEFFKNVIRNSMRRNQTGNISGKTRTSKSKNRPKKILYEGQIATPDNETEGENSHGFNQNHSENPVRNADDKADPGHQAVVVEKLHP